MLVLVTGLLLLAAPLYIIYRPPALLIYYFQHRWPDVLWHVSTTQKLMALTIDDGPSEYTKEIIQVLRANNAAATFFIIGSNVPGHEETLQDLIRHDNELANHAMHDEPSRSLTDADLTSQMGSVHTQICSAYAAVGKEAPPKYFRPGSGFFSTRMRELLAESGYQLVLGGVYPHDAQIQFWRVNAQHVLSMLRPGGIIVSHDRSWTAPMLRKVIPEMKRKGYRLVTITELLKERE